MNEKFKDTPNEEKEPDSSLKINEDQEESEASKIEIISPIGSEGRKISEKEINKSKRFIENMEELKDIKERKEKGELLSTVEVARLRAEKMGKKEDNAEIIELTDIVSDEEMNYYRKMPETDLDQLYSESKQFLEDPKNRFNKKYLEINKKTIGVIEKIREESNDETKLEDDETDNPEEQDNNENLKESWDGLESTRNEYIKLHQSYLREGVLSGVRSALGISPNREMSPELVEAKEKYDLAKKTYAQNEQDISLEKIDDNLSDEEKEKQKEQIKNKIYNIVVLDEQEYLQDARAESHPPKERGVFMKAYDRWTSLSKTKRLIYSTVMVAGVAGYATLAVPVTASAAALGMGGVAGKKLLRGSFGMLFAGLAGKIFDRQIAGKKDEITQKANVETESAREEFNLDNLDKIENQYKDAMEQERKGNRNILIRKALVMGGAGMTSAMGLGMADNAMAGTNSDSTPNPEPSPIIKPIPDIEPLPVIDPDKFFETAQKGDSIWKMAEDQLNKHYGERFSGLEEAQKTYLIDAIKDKVAENPEGFGMTDVDELKVDQKIDFSKAFSDESEVNKFFEKANNLSDVDKENILSNNQKIEDWVKENPDGKLDSEQVEEILNPVIETNISDADDGAKTEFEFEGTVEREVKAMSNVTDRLTEIGEGHRLFGWGSGQFMKEGGEWDKLKDLKVQEVTKEGFDYYGKNALDKAVNGATQDNLKGLNNYLDEAKKLMGGANKGDTLEEYLKRYEVVKQL